MSGLVLNVLFVVVVFYSSSVPNASLCLVFDDARLDIPDLLQYLHEKWHSVLMF